MYNCALVEQVVFYQSALIPHRGFVHGFPERTGGVSVGPRRSLNLGVRWGDDAEAVAANRAIVAQHAGFALSDLQVTKHVHGTTVWRVGEPVGEPAEYDGLVTEHCGPVLGAFAADCMPIIFADPVARVIGACHAGWRGAVGGVAQNTIARMTELGAQPGDIIAAVGPSIGPCCFEVGDEVVDAFVRAFGNVPGMVVAGHAKPHVDLRRAVGVALARVGVREPHMDLSPPCTRCHPERFFSYRRDGQAGGVHMGFIGMREIEGTSNP